MPLRSRRSNLVVLGICLALCIATVFICAFFGRGHFYISAVSIVIFALIPFFASYEASRIRARDVCMIAVMCALSVASRVLFIWLPHFKPTAGMVMISGLSLGPKSGFLIGAMTMLLSNFLFGQGYWTPWQMLAFGAVGLIFGFVGRMGIFKAGRLSSGRLAALGALATLLMIVVAGPILDTSSAMMFLSTMSPEGLIAIYLAGFPINVIQGISACVTVIALANPILGKLARVKVKYGIGLPD